MGGETIAHPLGIVALVVCAMAILIQSPQRAILPLIFFMIAIPSAQRIVIATLDFSFIRILIIITLVRIVVRGEAHHFKMEKPDTTLLKWMLWGILSYGLLKGDISGFITRTGYMLDTVGAYYLGRIYIRTSDDIQRIVLFLGLMAIPILIFFLIERATGKNIFSVFGGVPENTLIRRGRLRCQGPFAHPIMAGIFWASLLPWLGAIWFSKSASTARVVIFTSCIIIIVVNTASSTPVIAILFSLLGLSMLAIRHKMPLLRLLLALLLISLHMVMKAPVWHLISRIDLSGGSTGWHRFNLIEQSINHLDEWWLIGTMSTNHWGWGLQDMTNQYLLEGIRGGIIGMGLFIIFIIRIYALLGQAQRQTRSKVELWMLWSSGVMLFVHTMNFLAVAYFGQTNNAFFLFVGAIVSAAAASKQNRLQKRTPC